MQIIYQNSKINSLKIQKLVFPAMKTNVHINDTKQYESM